MGYADSGLLSRGLDTICRVTPNQSSMHSDLAPIGHECVGGWGTREP
jgi:hypothetical protein